MPDSAFTSTSTSGPQASTHSSVALELLPCTLDSSQNTREAGQQQHSPQMQANVLKFPYLQLHENPLTDIKYKCKDRVPVLNKLQGTQHMGKT